MEIFEVRERIRRAAHIPGPAPLQQARALMRFLSRIRADRHRRPPSAGAA